MPAVDPRTPCLIGVGQQTWHPDEVGEEGAPEPLAMWEDVARVAADDTGVASSACSTASTRCRSCTARPGSTTTRRRGSRRGSGVEPRHTPLLGHRRHHAAGARARSGASRSSRGELDVALVSGAEALATQRRYKSRGERYPYSFKPEEKRPFPWEAPFHPPRSRTRCSRRG